MKLQEFKDFLSLPPKNRREFLIERVDVGKNPRQAILEQNRDYYEGIHWIFSELGTTSTTRSGKNPFSKFATNERTSNNDPFGRGRNTSKDVAFHRGQIQTKNMIKKFTQFYEEYILGDEHDNVHVAIESNEKLQDAVNDFLDDNGFEGTLKTMLTRMVVDTVGVIRINYSFDTAKYYFDLEDVQEIFPIYEGGNIIGTVKSYYISKELALAKYGIESSKKLVTVADCYFPSEGNYHFVKLIDGFLVTKSETGYDKVDSLDDAIYTLEDELNYHPFIYITNLDHSFRNFDDFTLEDSEIFNWIEDNDKLNALETLSYLGNMAYVFPKPKIDYDEAQKGGIDTQSADFQASLIHYSMSSFTVDNMPIKTDPPKDIPQSFYDKMEGVKDDMFEDAGIPRFAINGNINAVSEKTITTALGVLVKKINQKRTQLSKGVKEVVKKYAQINNQEVKDSEIVVKYPDIVMLQPQELSEIYLNAFDRQLISSEYALEKILTLTGDGEDLQRVKDESNAGLMQLAGEIQQERQVRDQRNIQQNTDQIARILEDVDNQIQ